MTYEEIWKNAGAGMTFEHLPELDDTRNCISMYLERALFVYQNISEEMGRNITYVEDGQRTTMKRIIERLTCSIEIIGDYLCLLKKESDRLDIFVDEIYEQRQAEAHEREVASAMQHT